MRFDLERLERSFLRLREVGHHTKNLQERLRAVGPFDNNVGFGSIKVNFSYEVLMGPADVAAVDDNLREDCLAVSPVLRGLTEPLCKRLCMLLVVLVYLV